jgi:hypothetical protein
MFAKSSASAAYLMKRLSGTDSREQFRVGGVDGLGPFFR